MPVHAGVAFWNRNAHSLRYARVDTAVRPYAEDLYIVVIGFPIKKVL